MMETAHQPETLLTLWLHLHHKPSDGRFGDADVGVLNIDAGDVYKQSFVLTVLPKGHGRELPDWLRIVNDAADERSYSLIWFVWTGEVVDYLPTYP